MPDYEPKIVGFLCNWCTSNAADLAGTSRIQYPTNIRPIRVMCSGSVDSSYILKAFLEGADAVLLGGCHPGDCHYVSGNYKARRRATIMKTVLKTLELGDERFWVRWISASEGKKFAETVRELVDEMKTSGRNPLATQWSV